MSNDDFIRERNDENEKYFSSLLATAIQVFMNLFKAKLVFL